jgi:glycosyltransferase involved in cell wall biosynthesis
MGKGERTASGTPLIVQFCGRLEPRKAPEVLVDAIAIFRRELPPVAGCFAGGYAV